MSGKGQITTKQYPIEQLIFAEYNPRQLTKDQYQGLKDSITRFGLVDPVIVNKHKDRKNIIVGGHQRVKVAKDLGFKDVPCAEVSLTLDKERELNIRLNRNTGEWDWDSLANYFDVSDLLEWGFTDDDLQFKEPELVEGKIEDDEIPEVEEAITKPGDMWILGEHRVLCGDATKREDVDQLMEGQKADMVFTDPPYGIDLLGKNKKIGGDGTLGKSKVYRAVINDDSTDVAKKSYEINKNFADNFIIWGGNYFTNFLPASRCWIVWDKQRPPQLTFCGIEMAWTSIDMHPKKYDWLWDGGKRKGSHKDELATRVHPTQKPVGMINQIFTDFKFSSCIDPFLGSGSTLIACEKTNRKCYGMEIDPHYCDVIVKRWEEYTGNKAERIEAASA